MECSYCPKPKEIMYQTVNYNSTDVVQGLLKFYETFYNQAKTDMNTEILAICMDMQKALKNIHTTEKQRLAIALYMDGWTEEQIGGIMNGITHQAVHKLIIKVCKKVTVFLTQGVAKEKNNNPILYMELSKEEYINEN
jgi:hypothetical protein